MTSLLLAEPEESMRGFLERQLSSDGFDVLAFCSPDELPRAAEPDVLLLGDPDARVACLTRPLQAGCGRSRGLGRQRLGSGVQASPRLVSSQSPPESRCAISQTLPAGSVKLAVRTPHSRSTGPLRSGTPRAA